MTSATPHPDQQQGELVPDQDDSAMHHDDIGDAVFLAAPNGTGTPSYFSVEPASTYTAPMGDTHHAPWT